MWYPVDVTKPLCLQIFICAMLAIAGCATKVASPASAPTSPALTIAPCTPPGVNEPLKCGTYEVFENRDTKTGKTLTIAFTIAPATGTNRLSDAIVPIAGGPGDSVRRATAGMLDSLSALRDERDIVLIDVRGTGDSALLSCDFPAADGPLGQLQQFLPTDGVRRCARDLAKTRDLRQYTTRQVVDDLHEVLLALGYTKANLFGASYGTRAALHFMRRHPDFVRTANLSATVAFGSYVPFSFARDAQAALDGWFNECERDAQCNAAFPDLPGDLAQILATLDRSPVDIVMNTKAGPKRASVNRAAFVQTIRYMSYLSAAALEIPLAIHLAAKGDYSIIARYASLFGGMLSSSSDGLYLSVTCAEDVPFVPEAEAEIAAATRGTYLGDYRIRQQQAACRHWPRAEIARDFHAPLASAVPTLLVSGALDPVTPASGAVETAKRLAHSAVLIVPYGGHDFVGLERTGCIRSLEQALVRTGNTENLDVDACRDAIRRPAFVTTPPRPALALSSEALSAYLGTYSAETSPFKLTIKLQSERLVVAGLGPGDLTIEPTSKTDFRFADLPPSFSVTFRFDEGRVAGLTLKSTGQPDLSLDRE